ncbi:MAG: chorismate-binding protein [Bdellovibrionales bacterium]|nr:chorismate-binding protein [Bdellovibrionales bacterium]
MLNSSFFESFLAEGLILQDHQHVFIAKAPFEVGSKPHPSKICFYCPDFFSEKDEFIISDYVKSLDQAELLDFLSFYQERHSIPSWVEPEFDDFKKQFDDFQSSKHLIKVVPVVFAQSDFMPSFKQRAFLLKNILEKHIGFAYGYWNSNQGLLGVTPEYLFEKKGEHIKTMALAGTGLISDSLIADEKEMKEHQIVVDDLSDQLHDFRFEKSAVYEKTFGELKHLQTDLQFQSDVKFLSLVQKLHPTSALGGSPKEQAMKWLLRYNHIMDRKRFGAPFAIHFPNGDGFALTAIRNIQWGRTSMILGSGCGLTAKSKLEKEWRELLLKREWVIRQLWT